MAEVEELKSKGNDLFKKGCYNEAIDVYSKALLINKENATLYSNRSAALSKIGKFNDALSDACQCIHYGKEWSKGYLRKIVALEGMKDYPNVMEAAEEGYKHSETNQMKKEFVKRWFDANQCLYQLPPNCSIDLPRGIYVLSQKYFNILMLLQQSQNGERPLNSSVATQCAIDCVEQMDTLLKCFGEPIQDPSFLYRWADVLIRDIYPYNTNLSNKKEMEVQLLNESDKVVSFLKVNVDPSLYLLLRPLFALIVLIMLNRTNILCESNAGHHKAEIMNKALIPFFEMDILNTKEYQYLYIGRLCAILDTFVGRTYKLDISEKSTVKFYYKKLQKAIGEYPSDLPDHSQCKSLGESCMANIDANVLDHQKPASSIFDEPISASNAMRALEFGEREKVQQYINERFLELSSVEFLTMGEVEEIITMTEIFLKIENYTQALESFKKGEKAFFDVLGRLLEKNALKIDQCSTTIAIIRQFIFISVKLLRDPVLYSDVAFRWKCLFTQVRALLINFGFRGIISEFFIDCINGLTSSSKDDDFIAKTVLNQMKKEELLLQSVAKKALNAAYSCKYDEVLQSLDNHSVLVDYVFFTTTEESASLMEATCIIVQRDHDPVICDLEYSKIRKQSASVIDVITKARKRYWVDSCADTTGRVHFELGLLADLLFPDILKRKLLSRTEIKHLYISLEGDLALIPFGMFPLGDDRVCLDQLVSVSVLGSVHQLHSYDDTVISDEEQICYIVADPNFNCQLPKPASFFANISSLLLQYLNITAESSGTILEQLDNSESEADFISYSLCSRGLKVQRWLQDDANLKNLMTLKQPLLLHISTHGYSKTSRTVYRGNFFTDLSSGLALAGFNTMSKQLYDQIVPECSLGEFPALAVLSLDLHCTKLVYLSTCDSASGVVTTQEELVSLSSAFLAAGAETVVATLWPVKDAAAAEFSKYFYDHLLNVSGARPSHALGYARKKLSEDPVWNHWCHWGAYACYGSDKPFFM